MCDIKSSTMVVLGDVKLPEQDAVRHLKEYRDYQDRKKLKNKWTIWTENDSFIFALVSH
jgi:hypothetical protein